MSDIHNLDNPFHIAREAAAVFHQVELPPPEDWIPAHRLFPSQAIVGFKADYKNHDADSWAKFILENAEGFAAATSCASFSGEAFLFTRTGYV